jgi:soluble lytic murein transglycosylase
VLRLRVHRLVPTPGSFAFELDRLTRYFADVDGGLYEFAEGLVEGGFPLEAIVIGRRLRADEGEWNLRLLRIVYPFPHRETVVRLASERGLDPFFVAGLIRQESAFDARIRSSSGAVGLMQLMPPTAREVAGSLGITYSPEVLTDPETNLRLGTTYLASMVRSFGRAEDVLSAYNAGPGRMRGWRGEDTYGDRDVFIEHIPFDETRTYVKAVQAYARVYTTLYGCGDFEPCLGLSYSRAMSENPLAVGLPGAERRLD